MSSAEAFYMNFTDSQLNRSMQNISGPTIHLYSADFTQYFAYDGEHYVCEPRHHLYCIINTPLRLLISPKISNGWPNTRIVSRKALVFPSDNHQSGSLEWLTQLNSQHQPAVCGTTGSPFIPCNTRNTSKPPPYIYKHYSGIIPL